MKASSWTAALTRAVDSRTFTGLATRPAVRKVALVTTGVAILSASAWLSVPFYPVPLTMQTLAVLLVAGVLGPRLGLASVAGYLVLGLAGAPVFHNGAGGPAVLFGPTGGYLIGFLPAVVLMGLAASRSRTGGRGRGAAIREFTTLALGTVLAEVAIYAVGLPWLAVAYTGGDLVRAAAIGAVPYLLGDLLKMAVAIGAIRMGTRALSRRGLLPF